jgi:hypothetical protein
MEIELASETKCFLNRLHDGKVQRDMIVLGNFSHPLLSLLYTHEDLEIQNLVWLCMVQFIVTGSVVVQFGASYTNLK